jgi:putative ABC transport system permease protein
MFDLIVRNITNRKLRTGLTVFGIALGIFAVIVMGGMSEHFNMTFDRSLSLTADKIRVMPEGGIFGVALKETKVRDVKKVPGVHDAFGMLQVPLDPEKIMMFGGDIVIGIPPEKQKIAMKDTKLKQGRFLVQGATLPVSSS